MLKTHESLWSATAERPHYPSIGTDCEVDVAVIGAGIAGVLTAWHLKLSGLKVALLDAGRCLDGVTANTTAKISVEHDLIYSHLVGQLGEEKARLYATANTDAIDWIQQMCTQREIPCDFSRKDLYVYARTAEEWMLLEKEHDATVRAGLTTSLTTSLTTPFLNRGGLLFPNQAQFHPLNFLHVLLADIPGDGNYVFEFSRVIDVEDDKPCLVYTETSTVRADQVVVATNYPTYDPAAFYTRLSASRDYAIAIETPRPVLEAQYVGIGDAYTLRTALDPSTKSELTIISGEMHKVGEGEDMAAHYGRLEAYAHQHFPSANVRYQWSAQDPVTLDRIPYIGRIGLTSESVYIATGFGGWGMTHGVVSGQLLADLIRGIANPYKDLYTPERFGILSSTPSLAENLVSTVKHFVGDRLKGALNVRDLQNGQGSILETSKGKVAAYRDHDGALHGVAAECSHMGCLLAWNNAELSWDCPCHGSRFSIDGAVLQGPAIHDLESKPIEN